MVPVSGLWKGESKDGDTYFKGTCGSMEKKKKKNKFKTKENQPDFNLFFKAKEIKKDWAKKENDTPSFTPSSFADEGIPF